MLTETSERQEVMEYDDRCGTRTKLALPGQLRASGGRPFQTMVQDLSISGFSAAAINRMHVGQTCWITLPGLQSLQAEVIWWENSLVGCAFSELLSPIVHDNIIAKHMTSSVFRSLC